MLTRDYNGAEWGVGSRLGSWMLGIGEGSGTLLMPTATASPSPSAEGRLTTCRRRPWRIAWNPTGSESVAGRCHGRRSRRRGSCGKAWAVGSGGQRCR